MVVVAVFLFRLPFRSLQFLGWLLQVRRVARDELSVQSQVYGMIDARAVEGTSLLSFSLRVITESGASALVCCSFRGDMVRIITLTSLWVSNHIQRFLRILQSFYR